jgi:hypothetical protein
MNPPKRKFEFDAWEGLCDVYVEGQKIREGHAARHGHVYLHLAPDFPAERVTVEPFDSRVDIGAVLQGGCVVETEAGAEAASKAAQIAEEQAALKREAERRAAAQRAQREAQAKQAAQRRIAAAEAVKAAAEREAKAAREDAAE